MNQMETGLRHRLRRAVRQIATQHEQLRSLHGKLSAAIDSGRIAEVRECTDRLRGAIDAHFALEEGVFFPAAHGLHPESTPELNLLAREHRQALADLDHLRDDLATRSMPEIAQVLRDFSDVTAEHEAREERLLESLADLLDDAP